MMPKTVRPGKTTRPAPRTLPGVAAVSAAGRRTPHQPTGGLAREPWWAAAVCGIAANFVGRPRRVCYRPGLRSFPKSHAAWRPMDTLLYVLYGVVGLGNLFCYAVLVA